MIENEKYLRAYFGISADYYLNKYRAFHSGDRFTFNIASFLVGGLWFLYRKLWTEAIIIMLVLILTGILEDKLFPSLALSPQAQTGILIGSSLVLGTIYGFVGNYCYLVKAERHIHEILDQTRDEDERMMMITNVGGISWIPLAFLGLILVLMIMVR